MMRVTVDILPHGDELRPRRMVTMHIINVSGLDDIADYKVEAVLNPGQPDMKSFVDHVRGHRRILGYARLVERAITLIEPLTTLKSDVAPDEALELFRCDEAMPGEPKVRCSMITDGHGPEHKRITKTGRVTHRWEAGK